MYILNEIQKSPIFLHSFPSKYVLDIINLLLLFSVAILMIYIYIVNE